MIWNYLRSAVRNLLRQRAYGAINIVGLAIGMASSLALILWVADELSYDQFHENGDRIVRVGRSRLRNDQMMYDGVSSPPVGPAIRERFPGVRETCCIATDDLTLRYEDRAQIVDGLFVDTTFFDIFSFRLLKGDPTRALQDPNSIVITPSVAVSLFGNEDPIGKTLGDDLVVTGIVAEPPENSHLQFGFVINNEFLVRPGDMVRDAWFHFGYETYLLLDNATNVQALDTNIRLIYQEADESENTLEAHLQPLTDIHLKSLGGGGRITYVYIFSLIAALLLAVASINFVNLATARATQRAKEVAVRKVVGASRWQLGAQVMFEQLMQTTLALILAICLLEYTLPMLSGFFGKNMALVWSLRTVGILVGVSLATGLAAGIYPSMILSSYRPAVSLRSSRTGFGRGSVGLIRKGLVVFQFAISAGLIFAALVINNQMTFIRNMDLGLNHEAVVCVTTDNLERDSEAFERTLAVQPGVEIASAVHSPPSRVGLSMSGFNFEGQQDGEEVSTNIALIDYNYVDVFGLQIVDGRNFSKDYGSDAAGSCLINESAVRAMHMDNPVGKTVGWMDDSLLTIVGVVRDFHYASLHEKVGPLIMVIEPGWYRTLCIRLKPGEISAGLASVERTFKEFRPDETFNFSFFDEELDREYRLETRTRGIAFAFTLITTIVAILGLLGLAATSIERRTKEIGIRKTLGSSTSAIVRLVSSEFMILILLGNAVMAPIAYYLMTRWLDNFAYRIRPSLGAFLMAVIITVLGALVAISFKAIRAARANPVKALKYE